MTTLEEGDLLIRLPEGADGRKFDGPEHSLSHCMKAVDWIFELEDHTYFVELKDLDVRNARSHKDADQFIKDLSEGKRDVDFIRKFRDSFLYEWAAARVQKPITYLLVIACSRLDPALLQNQRESLQRKLPTGAQKVWKRPIAEDCLVFNIKTWNETFPEFPLARTSVPDLGGRRP